MPGRELHPLEAPGLPWRTEVDFDSAPRDIAAGAAPIPANFIQNGEVTAKILTRDGRTVISDTVDCRVRN